MKTNNIQTYTHPILGKFDFDDRAMYDVSCKIKFSRIATKNF